MCLHPCYYLLMYFHIWMCISAKEWPAPGQNGNKKKVPCKNVVHEHVPEMNTWYRSDSGSSNCYVLTCFQENCRHWMEAAQLYGCNIQAQTETLIKCCIQSHMGLKKSGSISLFKKKKGNSNSHVFSWHCFPFNLLYHRGFADPCDFICWASESTCQSLRADEQ